MITPLTSPPPFLTPPELTQLSSSTPESFVGIPPLLKWTGKGTVKILPAWKKKKEGNGEESFGEYEGGKGTVWVTEGSLSFLTTPSSSSSPSQGLSIPYLHITLHALSRTGESMNTNDQPCIYCQIDEIAEGEVGVGGVAGDGGEGGEEFGESWEVLIVPEEEEGDELDSLFTSLTHCASLHPPSSSLSTSSFSNATSNPNFQGLDMDSLVYKDAEGNLVGGTDGRGGFGEWEDAEEDEEGQEGEGGRVRSDFVGLKGTRKGPY